MKERIKMESPPKIVTEALDLLAVYVMAYVECVTGLEKDGTRITRARTAWASHLDTLSLAEWSLYDAERTGVIENIRKGFQKSRQSHLTVHLDTFHPTHTSAKK